MYTYVMYTYVYRCNKKFEIFQSGKKNKVENLALLQILIKAMIINH